jgi:Tol biopolymer transport system component
VIGTTIGPYRIEAKLGEGGMGQVYRARDAKLDRDVALKILPDAFAADPDRLARFRREARILASLNHPNIAHIYGLEDAESRPALVLELVEGPTLADLITGATNRLTLVDALPVAAQIAEALEAAHELGIVHRDLKPANVKVTPDGRVKVLDFGLARALDDAPAPADESMESPTVTRPIGMTAAGMILGTAPYMSPEQARGKTVDKRADIWAFGCVLFELLTGRRPFRGDTTSDVIAAILEREPAWAELPARTPAKVRALLQRCLEKDARRRLRDIGEARIEIERVINESSKPRLGASAAPPRWWAALGAGVLLVAAAFMAYSAWGSREIGPLQYTQLTDFLDSATAASFSPDGRMVTFIRGGPYFTSAGQIYVKQLPNGEAARLTNDPRPKFAPVFTPDGSRIAFSMIDNGSWDTWTVPVLGGEPSRMLANASGLSWLSEKQVLFSEIKSGLHMGIVTATDVRANAREIYFPNHERAMAHYSAASPDRKWILIVEMGPGGGFSQRCRLVPFGGSSAGEAVGPHGACRAAAWSPDGRWMYFGATVDDRAHLWRQAFPNGAPEQLTFDPNEEEGLSVSPDGKSLVTSVGITRNVVWIREGASERQLTSEGSAQLPRLSRDGAHVFYLYGEGLYRSHLRRMNLAGASEDLLPGWPMGTYELSPDETEVIFTVRGSQRGSEIWLAPLDRRNPPRQVTTGGDQPSFGPDGSVIFREMDRSANYLARVNRDGSNRQRLLPTPILNKSSLSPDRDWSIVARAANSDNGAGVADRSETLLISLRDGSTRRLCAFNCLPGSKWSHDGLLMSMALGLGRTVQIPVPPGRVLPELPPDGFASPADAMNAPGARVIEGLAISATGADTYVFLKTHVRRNLFRIDLR